VRAVLVGVAIAAAFVALLVAGGLWWLDQRVAATLARRYDVPLVALDVPNDSASLAAGERLAWFHGCRGCHDAAMQGKVFLDEPRFLRLVAPSIGSRIADYSDAELARLVRHGVRRDGTGVVSMPVRHLYELSDHDVARLVAYLRAAPVAMAKLPPTELRIFAKLAVLEGELLPDAATMDHAAPRLGARADTSRRFRGEYLARTICAECHGADLMGMFEAPPLARAYGYAADAFVSLLLDGRSRDGRELPLMGRTARSRFVHFTREEIGALYAYLQALAPVSTPGAVR